MTCPVCRTEFTAPPCECGTPAPALHDRACPARRGCRFPWCAGFDGPLPPLTEAERDTLRGYASRDYPVSGQDVLRLLAERDALRDSVIRALDSCDSCRLAVLAALAAFG